MEEWRNVEGYDYEVSSEGRVRRSTAFHQYPSGYIIKGKLDNDGYPVVSLSLKSKYRHVKVSVLVCCAFHGPKPTSKHQAAHWDGNKRNNFKGNLRWATCSENEADKIRQGKRNDRFGEGHPACIITEDIVRSMRLDRMAGMKINDLASKYALNRITVYDAIRGTTWGHVQDPGPVGKTYALRY